MDGDKANKKNADGPGIVAEDLVLEDSSIVLENSDTALENLGTIPENPGTALEDLAPEVPGIATEDWVVQTNSKEVDVLGIILKNSVAEDLVVEGLVMAEDLSIRNYP